MTSPDPARFANLFVDATRNLVPFEVAIELTHHCNFRCQHCYIPDFSAPDLLSTERLLSLLEELSEMGTLFVTLTGGEMFLRKDWFVVATRARELGFSLRLFTNASLIDEEIAERAASLWCPVEISLYSMDAEVFERITRRKGSFEKTIRGIERLRERDVEVLLKAPIMSLNAKGFEKIAAYAERIGAEARADVKIMAKKNGDLVTIQLRADEDALVPLYRGGHTPCSLPGEYESDPRGDGPLCAAGNRYANITSSGDVMACNILPVAAGNVRESSFREIWEGSSWLARLRAIRRKNLRVCDTCDKFSYCGRCHAQAMVEDGDIMGPSSWACQHAETLERLAGTS